MPLAARWYLPRAAGVIGVSQGVSEDIRRAAGLKREKVHTIYNPILTEDFYRKAAAPVDDPWFVPDRDWLTVVTVGRLTAQKDHDTLLRAIAQVKQERPVRLVVLGQGERRAELEALAQELDIGEIVEFAGFDPNPYRYIAAADVFALSSRWEGFGNVLVEALACGTKVVSTDCPSGPSEVLGKGAYGELVPVGDSGALASGILKVANSPIAGSRFEAHLQQFESSSVTVQYVYTLNINNHVEP